MYVLPSMWPPEHLYWNFTLWWMVGAIAIPNRTDAYLNALTQFPSFSRYVVDDFFAVVVVTEAEPSGVQDGEVL